MGKDGSGWPGKAVCLMAHTLASWRVVAMYVCTYIRSTYIHTYILYYDGRRGMQMGLCAAVRVRLLVTQAWADEMTMRRQRWCGSGARRAAVWQRQRRSRESTGLTRRSWPCCDEAGAHGSANVSTGPRTADFYTDGNIRAPSRCTQPVPSNARFQSLRRWQDCFDWP